MNVWQMSTIHVDGALVQGVDSLAPRTDGLPLSVRVVTMVFARRRSR